MGRLRIGCMELESEYKYMFDTIEKSEPVEGCKERVMWSKQWARKIIFAAHS